MPQGRWKAREEGFHIEHMSSLSSKLQAVWDKSGGYILNNYKYFSFYAEINISTMLLCSNLLLYGKLKKKAKHLICIL
jgi:hypothetical protein